ncbi:MAG: hypothetical protein KAW12_22985 [Candidatus Aminicenantes bacterium]|nr:hypothetical protein [Candidatus Aminicenantes bacterium]
MIQSKKENVNSVNIFFFAGGRTYPFQEYKVLVSLTPERVLGYLYPAVNDKSGG